MESNFVLEMVRQQEGAPDVTELLSLARARRIELAVPAFSIAEPYWTLRKDSIRRKTYLGVLSEDISQLRRSATRRHVVETASQLTEQLHELESDESVELDSLTGELARQATVVDLNGNVILAALNLTTVSELTMQDALVLASIIEDLSTRSPSGPCAFVSRDRKAFGDPRIRDLLQDSGCQYLSRFEDAFGLAKANA